MKKIVEREILKEFAESFENPIQKQIVTEYLKNFSIEDVEIFLKQLISEEVKENET